jgi:multidrug efflux pump subunit AcrA (membrane-fusion protein)
MRIKPVGFLCLAAATLTTCACGGDKSSSADEAKPASVSSKPTEPLVKPGVSERHGDALVVSGPIIVEHQVDLTAQRDGNVAKIFLDVPARVKTGAMLAQLDDRQIRANLEAAQAKSRGIEAELKNWESESEVLKADYLRAQRLWDLGLTSEEQLQHAKYKAESEQWDIKRVKESLNTASQEESSM